MLFFNPLEDPNKLRALQSLIQEVIKQFEVLNELPLLFHNVGLALLSILIPLAIAILADVYQKKKDREVDFAELDLNVILDRVFQIRRLIVFSLLIFVPFVFWAISDGYVRMFETFLSLIGMYFVIRIILNVYGWTKGNVFNFRFHYLEDLEDPPDLETVWKSVWSSKNIDRQNEIRFFEIFSSKIDKVVKHDEG